MPRLVIAALLMLCVASAVAADDSIVLIPTLYNGPGAFGSTWWSGVVINNHSASAYASPGVRFAIQCAIPEGCQSDSVPAGEFGAVIEPRAADGLLLHGDSAILSAIAFRGRFGQGIDYLTNGTQLPIVRERDFVRTPIRFPYVTMHLTQKPVRSTLRIYSPDAIPGTSVRVEVRSWFAPSSDARAEATIELIPSAQPGDVPVFPAFAQIFLQVAFPFEQLQGSIFNVSVVPLPLRSGELPRIWAFISTTENATQQVMVQTPQ